MTRVVLRSGLIAEVVAGFHVGRLYSRENAPKYSNPTCKLARSEAVLAIPRSRSAINCCLLAKMRSDWLLFRVVLLVNKKPFVFPRTELKNGVPEAKA